MTEIKLRARPPIADRAVLVTGPIAVSGARSSKKPSEDGRSGYMSAHASRPRALFGSRTDVDVRAQSVAELDRPTVVTTRRREQ